ncbi:MAG: PAS domain-containing protein [Candidatus Omnitrophica bacterium]|nr:PAS domain-containing protein [Candidatus Omnitrophota bacterium]MDD5592604.1 PAS domain-containing protein [Candidatus Omnitrophota bacterium]
MENANKPQEELLAELASLRKRISELEASQKILMTSEAKYRQIIENANSIIMVMDTKGNITFFNQFAQRFFGFYEKEILGKNVVGTIVSEKDLSGKDLVEMIQDIVQNPERHSVNENENIRSNGERVRVLWANKAIIGEDGSIKEILCIGNAVATNIQPPFCFG